jgi:hypothetical protein
MDNTHCDQKKRRRKPPPPTEPELLEAAIAAGDISTIIDKINGRAGVCWNPEKKTAKVEEALKTLYKKGGPPALIGAVLEQILKLDSILLLGAHLEVEGKLQRDLRGDPGDLSTKYLPKADLDKLARVQTAFLGTAKAAATLLHVLSLSERNNPRSRPMPHSDRVLRLADAAAIAAPQERAHG